MTQNNQSVLIRAINLIELGRHDEARQLLEEALRSDPDDADMVCALAESLMLSDPALAFQTANRSLALAPDEPRIHRVVSSAAANNGNYPVAIDHARSAVRLDPNSANHRGWLAQTICGAQASHLLPEAQASADKAISLHSTDPLSWYAHARVALLKNDVDEATRSFRQCLALDPELSQAQHALAHLNAHEGNRATALSMLQNLVATDPRNQKARRDFDLQLTALLGDILWAAIPLAVVLAGLALAIASAMNNGGG